MNLSIEIRFLQKNGHFKIVNKLARCNPSRYNVVPQDAKETL